MQNRIINWNKMNAKILKYLLSLICIAICITGTGMPSFHSAKKDILPAFTISIVSDNVKCFGEANGSAQVIASGGKEPYTYSWSTSETTAEIKNLKAGTYVVIVKDANGEMQAQSVTITQPNKLEVSVSDFVLTCKEEPKTIKTTVQGGTGPYKYLWSTGQTTPEIVVDSLKIYNVSVTDDNACKASNTVMFVMNTASPDINILSPQMFGCNKGQVELTAQSSVSTLSIQWSPVTNVVSGQNTLNAVVNKPGTYFIMVTDTINDCKNNAAINVEGILPLTSKLSVNNLACFGDTTASAVITLSGGMAPYTYTNSCCDSVIYLNNLNAGWYSLIIHDNTTCVDTVNFQIKQPAILNASLNLIDLYPPFSNYGKASCYPQGGTPPYQILWSNGDIGANADSLAAGKYEVTISDANGCSHIEWFFINDHQCNMIINLSGISPIDCFDGTGSACVEVIGGNPSYNYIWTNGETTQCLINIPAGYYGVEVTDQLACKAVKYIDFTQPNPISLLSGAYYIKPETGFGFGDASIDFLTKGGIAPYTFEYDKGANGHLPAGKNIVTVTDSKGCMNQFSFIIPEYDCKKLGIHDAIIYHGMKCQGELDTACVLFIDGGLAPYTYYWPNASSMECYSTIPDTGLLMTITDSKNCIKEFHPYSDLPGVVDASFKVVNASLGQMNGSITITNIIGGYGTYWVKWMDGSTNNSLSNLGAGIYCLTITDGAGCAYQFCEEIKLTTATNNITEADWTLFPNPVYTTLHLKNIHNTASRISWSIYDMLGKKLMSADNQIVKEEFNIALNDLLPGNYYIYITEANRTYLEKFQKE